ncbi:unnamed protein product [Paramecium pentaurelia]|uniref:non-specific serine/threonine protein kinase n=1 Tax=Paramecium pentaurelia TaxID=43138 RepID=A0A8S1VGB3_9CILI|nr:unnamed protein product [Paramecium pentaurelia]
MKGVSLQNQLTRDKKMNIKNFYIIGMIGQGAYSEVFEAVYLKNNKKVAIKKVFKESITQSNKQAEIYIERHMMKQYSLKHPRSFQDKQFLYFVCEHCPFGDLGNVVWDIYQEYKKDKSSDVENLIKIYIYQIATAIIYLHKEGIAHLDIKPKNIIIDKSFNLRLTDFATCYFFEEHRQPPELIEQIKKFQQNYVKSVKRMENEISEYRSTFVGTPEYISPEMLSNSRASKEADLWALGCIIYEFYHGKQPFSNKSENEVFNSILSLNYELDNNLSEDVSDLIKSLLTLNPQNRLGYEDSEQILAHKYFDSVRHYVPWLDDIEIPNQCKILFQEIIPTQSKSSLIYQTTSTNVEMKQQLIRRRQDRLKTIMEELEETATPVPNIFKRTQKISHNINAPIIFEKQINYSSNRLENEMQSPSSLKQFDKSVGFIQLNTNRWFCIPQIAILFGYLKPPCLLIDFIKGEKKYLPIDDTIKISQDGIYYILESSQFFYKFKDAEAKPINWIQVVQKIKNEYLGK